MLTERFETPVALFVFNRPETTRRVFDAIAKVRPARLLLIADGPRAGRPGEAELCRQVREIVSRVDWPCEVSTNFSDENLGCDPRILTGLDWVFSLVEEAIIFEDDCLPDPSFFPFCDELLKRYRGDRRVISISGTNLVAEYEKTDDSYWFSQLGGNWGWATWRSQWLHFDRYLEDWPKLKRDGMLAEIFDSSRAVDYWTRIFDAAYASKGDCAWDYRWFFTRLKNHGLSIVPRVNLIANIGFGEGATHTRIPDPRQTPLSHCIDFPLRHPAGVLPSRNRDRRSQRMISVSYPQRIARKIYRDLHLLKLKMS